MLDPTDLLRFQNMLRMRLIGASDNGIKAELYDVLHTFFDDSNSWTEDLTVTTVQNQQEYDIAPAEDGQIVRLAGVLDQNMMPVAASLSDTSTLYLRDLPNAGQVLTVTVIKTVCLPTDSTMVPIAPDWTLKLYAPYVMAGVMAAMQGTATATYYDPKSQAVNLAKFRSGIARARRDALHRHTVGVQSWVFPQSFATRNQRSGVSAGNDQRF